MAMTLRLSDDLAQRGRRYAAELGISLNGLLAVALREYLDARKRESRTHRRRERKRWRKQWRGKSWPGQCGGVGKIEAI
jgi:predicted transcriptional regulator